MRKKDQTQGDAKGTISVVDRNIKALLAQRQMEEQEQSWEEKLAIAITQFTGSMLFISIHLLLYGAWVAINLGWIPGLPRFDPTLVTGTVVASVETIFLAVFILITQRRMMAQADRRADLTLQISLLAEYEITQLIALNKEMAKKMGIEDANRPELDELAQDVAPEQVLEQLDEHEQRYAEGIPFPESKAQPP
jgi:uncharacterized membrane protein